MRNHMRRVVTVAAVTLTLIGFGTVFQAAQPVAEVTYEVRPLDSLGGSNSRGQGVNDWGLVSGFSNLPDGKGRRAVVWFKERMFRLDPLGGTNSSIAWSGQSNDPFVVGITQTNQPQSRTDGWSCRAFFPVDATTYTCVGFAWDGSRMKPLPALGGDNSFAASANGRREVVGWAETKKADSTCVDPTDRGFRAVVWDLAARKTIKLARFKDDSASAATAISDRGHVVGISGDCDQSVGRKSARHAVMWHNGKVNDLGNVGSDTWNTPTAITRRGDIVVGFANAPGASADTPQFRAWLWTKRNDIACAKLPGKDICDLGTLDAGGTAEAWGVNERGQVVGTACSSAGFCRAFLWESGEMKDLDLLKRNYPHRLLNAMDINNLGQVTGRAQITSTSFEAFIATPTRED